MADDVTPFNELSEIQQCQVTIGMLTQLAAITCSAHDGDSMARALVEAYALKDYEVLSSLAGKLAGAVVLAGGGVTRAGATH